ncbi:glycoside hydrolase, partial [Fragilariopsis cylindrus CCMP1102]
MVHYLHATAAYNQAEPLQNGPLLTGWCSWYHYYENITEENLRRNFSRLATMKKQVPTNMAMVDDGYMTAWGDWDSLKPKKFTTMDVVASDIASSHMRPGLWMAPFTADKHSKIIKNHPEWIIRNEKGHPANSSNCGKFFYGLDATNPQVRDHVFTSVRRAVRDWGFRVLKIDFLYAASLEGNGKYDMSMSRAEAMHLALQTIREAAGPNVFLIGCGCPMGTGIGYIDGMRVSADTGPSWYPEFPLPWFDNGTLPSLRGMIRNSMSRAPMGHRWWQNDPDCLLLGESTKLTHEEVVSAASIIAMTCGMLLISDDLSKVSQDRLQVLNRIVPMT